MYKYKSDSNGRGNSHCPMGALVNGLVDCYWFGLVGLDKCNGCSIRKDKELIKK